MAGVRAAAPAFGFGVVAVLLRLWTRATFPTEWDSAQLSLGVHAFDVRIHQPHAPGYWLYVGLGRAVWWVTPFSAHTSLVIVSALGGGVAVALAFAVGRRFGGTWLGVAMASVFVTSPLLWFYGSTVATYGFDAIGSLLVLWFAARGVGGRWERLVVPFVVALQGGFRPSLLVFLAPVVGVLCIVRRTSWRSVWASAAAGAVGVLVWLVPMAIDQPGGLRVLRRENTKLWSDAAHFTSPLFGASSRLIETNVLRTVGWTVSSVALLVIPLVLCGFLGRSHLKTLTEREGRLWRTVVAIVVVQVASALLLHFGKAGYVVGYFPALALAMLLPASRLSGRWRGAASVLVAVVVLVQGQRFLFADGVAPSLVGSSHEAPYRVTRSAIAGIDTTVARHLSLGDDFPADRGVFVFPGGPGDNLYRQLSYLLPELELHFLADGQDWTRSRDRVQSFERDGVVEAPRGSDLVVVTTAPDDALRALERGGSVEAVELSSGGLVWVVLERGAVLHGVRLG